MERPIGRSDTLTWETMERIKRDYGWNTGRLY